MKQIIKTDQAPSAIGPYSQAVIANGFLFVSGQLPINPQTGIMAAGIQQQTRQVLENVSAILADQKLTLDHVVKTTVFLQEMNDFQLMNEVYADYFRQDAPARACFQVAKLPKNALVEIEAIAIL